MKKSGMLSVVLPAYNEEAMIETAVRTIREILSGEGIAYELLLVNDGSKDGTWEQIRRMCESDPQVRGLCFSRNFGKEAAILAGLAHASGDVTAVLDCDLQHPPEKLVEMYRLWEQGYEVIEGRKSSRGRESLLHRGSADLFYRIMSRITRVDMNNSSDFKMLDCKAVDAILMMPEKNLFFRAASSWIGFRTAEVEFEVQERQAGESKWSSWSLIRYAFTNIVSFTTVPLQFVTFTGCGCLLCSVILLIYSLIQYFNGRAVEGYTTILIVLLMLGSAIMISLGIIGYYIAKIYEETKHRPRYLISRVENYEKVPRRKI